VSINTCHIGVLVFGGTDPVTGRPGYRNAFAVAFNKAKNLGAWAKVGAAPLTEACLNSEKVRHEAGVDGDPLVAMLRNMQLHNDTCCLLLRRRGYSADLLSAKLDEREAQTNEVTEPNTKERVEALAKATTHGERFHVTGGSHHTSDDMFKSAEMDNRRRGCSRRFEE